MSVDINKHNSNSNDNQDNSYNNTPNNDYGNSYNNDYGNSYNNDYGNSYNNDYGNSYNNDYNNNYNSDYGNNYNNDYNNGYNNMPANGYNNGTKFCSHCSSVIAQQAVICPNCGCQVENFSNNNGGQPIYINNIVAPYGKPKDKWVAFLLCLFLGEFGAHKFYEGKIGMGILYLFTLGFCGIGVIIDLIILLTKPNPYFV